MVEKMKSPEKKKNAAKQSSKDASKEASKQGAKEPSKLASHAASKHAPKKKTAQKRPSNLASGSPHGGKPVETPGASWDLPPPTLAVVHEGIAEDAGPPEPGEGTDLGIPWPRRSLARPPPG